MRKDKIYYAVGIFLGIIALVSLNVLSIVEASVLGVGLMLLTGCLRLQDLYSHLSWQTIVMLACLIPVGSAMENTGLASLIATTLVGELDVLGPVAVLSGIYLADLASHLCYDEQRYGHSHDSHQPLHGPAAAGAP